MQQRQKQNALQGTEASSVRALTCTYRPPRPTAQCRSFLRDNFRTDAKTVPPVGYPVVEWGDLATLATFLGFSIKTAVDETIRNDHRICDLGRRDTRRLPTRDASSRYSDKRPPTARLYPSLYAEQRCPYDILKRLPPLSIHDTRRVAFPPRSSPTSPSIPSIPFMTQSTLIPSRDLTVIYRCQQRAS